MTKENLPKSLFITILNYFQLKIQSVGLSIQKSNLIAQK